MVFYRSREDRLARRAYVSCNRGFGGGLLLGLAYRFFSRPAKVFVSYRSLSESHYKALLQAWSANKKFRFSFEDLSVGVSIRSEDERYIRRKIRDRLKESQIVLVLIGKNTHKSKWVAWEVSEAVRKGIPIIAVMVERVRKKPTWLDLSSVRWVDEFTEEKISNALASFH